MKKMILFSGVVAVSLIGYSVAGNAGPGQRAGSATLFETMLSGVANQPSGRIARYEERQDHGYRDDYDGRHDGHRDRIKPLGSVAHKIMRETGGFITEIELDRSGRYYAVEGVDRRGFRARAKADARTGQLFDVEGGRYVQDDLRGLRPIPGVLRELARDGFHHFDRVSLNEERGVYRVRGVDRRGHPVLIRVDGERGRILKVRRVNDYRGPDYARREFRDFNHWQRQLASQRYTDFGRPIRHDDFYEVHARDPHGRPVTLDICGHTGSILASRF